jgi:hypothetical protein
MPEPALIVIELVKTAALNRLLGRPQRWRWTARNGYNHRNSPSAARHTPTDQTA